MFANTQNTTRMGSKHQNNNSIYDSVDKKLNIQNKTGTSKKEYLCILPAIIITIH